MSSLRSNKIVNLNDNGPVEFSKGLQVPAGQEISGDIVINAVGIMTATAFSGVGIGITTFGVVNEVSSSKAIAYTIIG
jgi:hypothetical protein